MAAKVKWREDRQAWFLYVYANGTQKAKRLGPSNSDKRRGERLAREVERAQTKGALGLERQEKAIPFSEYADRWFEKKLQLPMERGESTLAPATVRMREEALRLHKKEESLCRELGQKSGLGFCYWSWGLLARALSDPVAEQEKLQQALEIFQALGMPGEEKAVRAELEQGGSPE